MSNPAKNILQAAALILSILVPKSGSSIFPHNSHAYESFEICLIEGGVNPNDVVPRSRSEAYEELNYQWQLKPPARNRHWPTLSLELKMMSSNVQHAPCAKREELILLKSFLLAKRTP